MIGTGRLARYGSMSAILNFGDCEEEGKSRRGKRKEKMEKGKRGRRVRGRGRNRKAGADQHQHTPEEAGKTGCSGGTKQVQALN